MRNPNTYTLGEIAGLFAVAPNAEGLECVRKLTMCIEAWQKQAAAYRVQAEIKQMHEPQALRPRQSRGLAEAALDNLEIVGL